MLSLHRTLWRWGGPVLAIALGSVELSARPNGFAAECGGCHYGQLEGGGTAPSPAVSAVFGDSRVEPGDQVDITVTVENRWPDAVVAGFLVFSESEAGVFTPVDEGTGNVGLEPDMPLPYAIGHTQARELNGGVATFLASWTAPETPGSYSFVAFAVTSDDGDGMDDPDVSQELNDPFGRTNFTIGVGCDLVSYFYDADMDGYGGAELVACDPPPGYVLQGGDCQDDNSAVHPGAEELCSFVDENCDGEVMAPSTYYRDVDGDGYGVASDILPGHCEPPEGYAVEAGDCAPDDPAVHPGAVEIPANGIDDNCDGLVDEPVVPADDTTALASPSAPVAMGGQASSGGGPGEVSSVPQATAPMGSGGTPGAAGGMGAAVEPSSPENAGAAAGCGVVTDSRGSRVALFAAMVLLAARRRLGGS